MPLFSQKIKIRRLLLVAAPLAVLCTLLLPTIASAHAILVSSDPGADARLTTPPRGVRMWFTEDLNPAFSTAAVVNGNNKRVDNRDAHVSPNNTKEMDLTLPPNLPPAVYIVIYRTDSADDGHILRGSFIFTVLNPDGSAPTLSSGANPGANVLGGGNLSSQNTGQLDGPAFFNLLMITLVELGAVFWVGAQLWLNFVLQLSAEKHREERAINEQVQARFERLLSLPTLLVLLLANIGVLIGQALNFTGGDWAQAFSPSLLQALATSGRFGTFWLLREGTIMLATVISLYMLVRKQRPRLVNTLLPLVNLLLGLILFIAITMSSHAASVSANIVTYAIVVDWLHLLAAALWVGGMIYIATSYLPVLKKHTVAESARSLTTVLPYFSPLAIAGVLILAVTGPFNATFHLTSWSQFIDTAYGRALLVKILLVGGLLITSAIHVGLLRPRLKKEHQKYSYVLRRQTAAQSARPAETADVLHSALASQYAAGELLSDHSKGGGSGVGQWGPLRSPSGLGGSKGGGSGVEPSRSPSGLGDSSEVSSQHDESTTGTDRATNLLAQQVKLREKRLGNKTRRLTSVLRWEPLLGVALLVCVGLMNVFGGTLTTSTSAATPQQPGAKQAPFTATVRTTDGKFNVTLNVNPNRFGTNIFTVSVVDNSTGKPATNIGVTLYTTMLDMDMGTESVNLLPDGKGHFSASGDLAMAGSWQIRIQIRTPDATLHETIVKLTTPF
jgi:copper transport protein